MCWPFGDTGVGKMGEMPPTSQAPNATARMARASGVSSARPRPATRRKYIDGHGGDRCTHRLGRSDLIESRSIVPVARKPRYVDVSNPSLTVQCPKCGLQTARFIDHCRNCGYKLWPSSVIAAAAFKAWRDADPRRAEASRFDLELPAEPIDATVDYAARAHQLGIHIFPSSNFPFIICVGALFLGMAAVPVPAAARITLAVIGGLIFLYGVVGWVLVEDVRMYPLETPSPDG